VFAAAARWQGSSFRSLMTLVLYAKPALWPQERQGDSGEHQMVADTEPWYIVLGSKQWIQPVDATHASNIFAGVLNPRVFRGRWFNCLAMASRLS
jgi:hypothetical protein